MLLYKSLEEENMGLDIYKLKPTNEASDFYFIKDDNETNKYRAQLFVLFKDYVKKEKRNFINWEETFKSKYPDLNMNDYDLASIGEYYIFIKKGETDTKFYWGEEEEEQMASTGKVYFKDDELKLQEVDVEVLYAEETAYQRKSMTDEFYDNFIRSCWYVKNSSELNENESNDMVLTKDKFKEAQSYAQPNSPIKSWDFIEGKDFIYFSY